MTLGEATAILQTRSPAHTKGKNLTPININNLIMQNGYVVTLAVGILLCVLTGNAVLGVGSVAASCGAVAGTLIVDFGFSTPLAMLAAPDQSDP